MPRHGVIAKVWVSGLVLLASAPLAWGQETQPSYTGTYFHTKAVNPRLGKRDRSINLATPQACVEHFVLSCRREDWKAAAHALNFRLIEPLDAAKAAQQAERLYYLLNQNLWIDWSLLPDRPDALDTGSLLSSGDPMAGKPRRSIQLGNIPLDGRNVPVRVERIKPEDGEPVWLFAAQTVDNIDPLYEARGPSWFARQAPEWSRTRLLWRVPMWQWLAVVLLVGLAIGVGWLVATVISRAVARRLSTSGAELVGAIRWPAAILTAGLVSYLSVGKLLTLPGGIAAAGPPLVLGVVVFSGTWLGVRVMSFIGERLTRETGAGELSVDESGMLARLTIARYVIIILIVAVGFSVLLISMDLFRTLGIALLSSAGAAAVIIGIAGHTVLGNLIAGVQIAITRPFRIGDTVIIEGYWGRIEQLQYTYVAVRTWDERRVVLPVKYFMDHWFENWTKTDPFLIKPIYLKVDYRADVQTIRENFLEIVHAQDNWAGDRDKPEVLVVECGEETITLRLTCAGKDSSSAWHLNCEVREKLIAWLQQHEDGRFLPRRRLVLHQGEEDQRDSGAQENIEPNPSSPGGDQNSEGGQ